MNFFRLVLASNPWVTPTLERFDSILAAERGKHFYEVLLRMKLEVKSESN
jgi:hypothetical protein